MRCLAVLCAAVVLAGCGSRGVKNVNMVGGQIDEHGCRPSAGYTWSEVRGDCIRVFEQGVAMVPVAGDTGSATYVVFSADSLRAEVFFAERRAVLESTRNKGFAVWTNDNQDMLTKNLANGLTLVDASTGIQYTTAK